MADRIALLGWGSLLWEGGREFECCHDSWQDEGPFLKIEFSRISPSRHGALTLVIDPKNGVPTKVAYCLSRRHQIAEAIEDLRKREHTTVSNIGSLLRNGQVNCRDRESQEAIFAWSLNEQMDAVVWTDLRSNFADKASRPFSVTSALAYLRALDPEYRADALRYIQRAPSFVQTPLRNAVTNLK
jgi:hypothetical protein